MCEGIVIPLLGVLVVGLAVRGVYCEVCIRREVQAKEELQEQLKGVLESRKRLEGDHADLKRLIRIVEGDLRNTVNRLGESEQAKLRGQEQIRGLTATLEEVNRKVEEMVRIANGREKDFTATRELYQRASADRDANARSLADERSKTARAEAELARMRAFLLEMGGRIGKQLEQPVVSPQKTW